MARANTKQDLIKDANSQFKKLCELINLITIEEQNKTFSFNYEKN